MEVRRQDKGILMPSSLGYNPTKKLDSSSNILISAFEERKRDDYHQNLHRNPPLFHHNQMNQPLKLTRDPDSTPDPTPTPAINPTDTVAPVPTRSASESPPPPVRVVRYRECLKNHAASKGGLVVDGCGEFMPTGDEGTPDALRCAACECHRSFHRKEIDGAQQSAAVPNSYYKNNNQRNTILATPTSQPLIHYQQQQQQNQNYRYPPRGLSFGASNPPTIVMTFRGGGGGGGGGAAESSSEDLNMFHSNMQGYESMQPSSLSKKRFRTKFTQEQKDKMMEFAEQIEWRIQKQDEQQVQQFCSKVGVKRKVFKVWMHNNKQAMKKKPM